MPPLKNRKHELLARNIVKEKFNLTEAYKDTYPASSHDAANANVHRIVRDSRVKNRIEEIAMERGLTPQYLINSLHEETQALKSIYYEGQHVADVPDHAARIESIKTGLKLYGFIGGDNQTHVDARSINVQLESSDVAALNATLRELKGLSKTVKQEDTDNIDSGGTPSPS